MPLSFVPKKARLSAHHIINFVQYHIPTSTPGGLRQAARVPPAAQAPPAAPVAQTVPVALADADADGGLGFGFSYLEFGLTYLEYNLVYVYIYIYYIYIYMYLQIYTWFICDEPTSKTPRACCWDGRFHQQVVFPMIPRYSNQYNPP